MCVYIYIYMCIYIYICFMRFNKFKNILHLKITFFIYKIYLEYF